MEQGISIAAPNSFQPRLILGEQTLSKYTENQPARQRVQIFTAKVGMRST